VEQETIAIIIDDGGLANSGKDKPHCKIAHSLISHPSKVFGGLHSVNLMEVFYM
jgi:hypothetical protein